jgi:hypothetical protein
MDRCSLCKRREVEEGSRCPRCEQIVVGVQMYLAREMAME